MCGFMSKKVPEATLRRFPIYHHFLKQLEANGLVDVSCTQIANELELSPIQVRKDIEFTGIEGKPKIGYNLKDLINHIENLLGFHINNEAVLVGAGHLGYSLLGYHGFKEYGLNILAAFDSSPDKIDKFINYKKVFSIDRLEDIVTRMKIQIGILTVPATQAQELADRMVKCGIKAIWNFAPVKISVPNDVIVQHENLASSLAVLTQKMRLNKII